MTQTSNESGVLKVEGNPLVCSTRVERIESITQVSGKFLVKRDAEPVMKVHHFDRPASAAIDSNEVRIQVGYLVLLTNKSKEIEESAAPDRENAIMEIEGAFSVHYHLTDGDAPSESDLQAFAEVNGRLNTVPYWREYVQNAVTRAGFPSVTIPPFNAAAFLAQIKSQQERKKDSGS